jgi:hypothetical protein
VIELQAAREDMERKLGHDDFLGLIPKSTLDKLNPFRDRLNEVFTSSADFAHLKYHILDELSLLRFCDREIFDFRGEVNKGISMGWIYDEDLEKHPWMLNMPRGLLSDAPTYDRVERAIRLHDIGRVFERMGIITPEEHHSASLFVALYVDADPIVCNAVLNHTLDVLPRRASIVSRCVRDIDRLAGAGYIGLIRESTYYGFKHRMLAETDEDKIINDGIMVTFLGTQGRVNEDKAEAFFWENVYPFFAARGDGGLLSLATLCKVMLDRIVGRNYRGKGRKLNGFEREVLTLDRGVRVVEPVLDSLRNILEFKLENTMRVLIRARKDMFKGYDMKQNPLTWEEEKAYGAWRYRIWEEE